MRIRFVAAGSRGDVQPFLALACELQRRGHNILFCTHNTFQEQVQTLGLQYAQLAGAPDKDLMSEAGLQWLESDRNFLAFGKRMMRLVGPSLQQMLNDTWEACRDAEAIVFNVLATAAFHICEKLRIPAFVVGLQPASPTSQFPFFLFTTRNLGPFLNRSTYHASEMLFWLPVQSTFNRWRQEVLQLPPTRFKGPFSFMRGKAHQILYAFSPHVIPRPPEWPSHLHVTGYFFLPARSDEETEARVQAFTERGSRPVYIGFGSMTVRDPAALAQIITKAIEQTGRRAVVLNGWANLAPFLNSDRVLVVDSISHSWLLPKMAAVVHHGGAGTTGAGLRAGVPNVVVPFFADQHFWAEKVYRMGAGPKPIRYSPLTADRLAHAIEEAVQNQEMKQVAAEFGAKIASEDGVGKAADIVEASL